MKAVFRKVSMSTTRTLRPAHIVRHPVRHIVFTLDPLGAPRECQGPKNEGNQKGFPELSAIRKNKILSTNHAITRASLR